MEGEIIADMEKLEEEEEEENNSDKI